MSVLTFQKKRFNRIIKNKNVPHKEVYFKLIEEISEQIPEEVNKFFIEPFRDSDGYIIVYFTCSDETSSQVESSFRVLDLMYDLKGLKKSDKFFKEELLL